MICFAKPVLTEDLYIVQINEFSITCLSAIGAFDERDKPGFSSERMLRKDYDRKGSVGKESVVVILKGLGPKTN
jgi:hypothetical protein